MKYGPGNCDLPAHVYDVDRVQLLKKVVSVDVDTGVVECYHEPLQFNHDGSEVLSFEVRFETIYPICAGGRRPTLFHCYGRLPQ